MWEKISRIFILKIILQIFTILVHVQSATLFTPLFTGRINTVYSLFTGTGALTCGTCGNVQNVTVLFVNQRDILYNFSLDFLYSRIACPATSTNFRIKLLFREYLWPILLANRLTATRENRLLQPTKPQWSQVLMHATYPAVQSMQMTGLVSATSRWPQKA